MRKLPPGYWKILRENRSKFFGPFIGAFLLFLLEVADRTDFFVNLFGQDSAVVKVIHWLAANPLWFTVALLMWALVAPFYLWWRQAHSLSEQFAEEWGEVQDQRQVLRDFIPPAHARWTGQPSSFAIVRSFVERVEFPVDLPFSKEEQKTRALQHYAEVARLWWIGDRRELLEFCMAIYPEHGETFFLDENQKKKVYEARMILSKFWNEWGIRCYDDESIKEELLRDRFQSWEVTLLTYLEIALALRNAEQFPGKQGLFRVGSEAAKMNNQ